MKKILKKSNIAPTLVALIPFALSLFFYARLPQRVAIHFDFNGMPDGFAPRAVAAFVFPVALFMGHLYMLFRLESEPKNDSLAPVIKTLMPWGLPLLSVVLQVGIISFAIAEKMNFLFWASLLCGMMMIVIGNYLPKCRHNYTFGIKLPWTLASEDNWNHTHRVAGYLYVICGIALMINSFAGTAWLLPVAIVLMLAVPFIVSYSYYKRHENKEQKPEQE